MMHTEQKRQRQTETRHWVENRHEDFGRRWGRGGKGEGEGEVGDGAAKQQRPGRSFECTLASSSSSSSSSSTNRRIKYTLLIPLIQT